MSFIVLVCPLVDMMHKNCFVLGFFLRNNRILIGHNSWPNKNTFSEVGNTSWKASVDKHGSNMMKHDAVDDH